MTGWLVYDPLNVARNRFFIDRWMQAAAGRQVDLRLVTSPEIAYGVTDNRLFLRCAGQDVKPDFVVMRAQHPVLSAHLEQMGIPCHNNARVADICNDKRKTHALFAGQLPMMDSAFLEPDSFHQPFPYPVVVKAAHGCGGRQIFLVSDDDQMMKARQAIAPDSLVVQPLSDETGKDLRVYVLDNRIIASMLRYSDSDFRSNVGLGGGSKPMALAPQVEAYVELVLQHFHFDLAGIDFIRHQGQWVFNEIEDAVGTRMLYMHTDEDIAKRYLDHILSRL